MQFSSMSSAFILWHNKYSVNAGSTNSDSVKGLTQENTGEDTVP